MRLISIQQSKELILGFDFIIDVYGIHLRNMKKYDGYNLLPLLLVALSSNEKIESTTIEWIFAKDDVYDQIIERLYEDDDLINPSWFFLSYKTPVIKLKLKD